jgi:thermostable 8-oxoguanine DNA glycosylase
MDCPICTSGKGIPIEELREHLMTGQHQMNNNVATYIVYLVERIEKLEQLVK